MIKKYVFFGLFLLGLGCGPKIFNPKWANKTAPEYYKTRFETSKGDFELEVYRKLSPKAADRFYQLVLHKYFNDALFYRVNPGFVAQFGSSDSLAVNSWQTISIPDENVMQGNAKGTLSFGRGGPNTRGTELYINLSDNHRLDTINYLEVKGFPTFGKVTQGFEVLESLYSGYSDSTMDTLSLMYSNKNSFLSLFPKLDKIKRVYIIK